MDEILKTKVRLQYILIVPQSFLTSNSRMNVKSMMPNIETFLGDYQHCYDKTSSVSPHRFSFSDIVSIQIICVSRLSYIHIKIFGNDFDNVFFCFRRHRGPDLA